MNTPFKICIFIIVGMFFVYPNRALCRCSCNGGYDVNQANKEQYIELREQIKAVQNENDKRFTVFLWGIGIAITLVGAMVTYSFFNNKRLAQDSAREVAGKEFLKAYKEHRGRINKILKEAEAYKVEIENSKLEIENYVATIKKARELEATINEKQNEQTNPNNSSSDTKP